MKELEIYIHIPFCVRKCAYCDFLSGPSDEESREAYVKLLCDEIASCKGKTEEYQVSTVFLGGGTPSVLSGKQIERIMQSLRKKLQFRWNAEITLEANPGTVNAEKLHSYKKAGINRLSIGLQSVHDEELKLLGRIHTYSEFLTTYHMARECGFDNINVYLISAIPGQTVESWCETLRTVIALSPEHISAYSLIIEPSTPFYEKYGEDSNENNQKIKLPSEDDERMMYWKTKEILAEAGYTRYEISNYAKPGFECRHNIGYWERAPYLGFGTGAATLFEEKRYTNPPDIETYRKSFENKFHGEMLSREEQMEEFMFLGLRMMQGVSKDAFQKKFGVDIETVYGEQIHKLKDIKLLEERENRIYLTDKGIDVSNAVFVEFMF